MTACARRPRRWIAGVSLVALLGLSGTAAAQEAQEPPGPAAPAAEVEGTTEPDDVVIRSWVIWIDQGAAVAVQHDLQVENTGDTAYLGTDPADDGTRAVLAVPLAPGAEDLQFLGRFTECCAQMRGTSYVHTAPLEPGTVQGTLRYTTPALDRLEVTVGLPTENLRLLVPPNLSVASDQLRADGQLESQGNTYSILTAEGLEPGDVLSVGLSGFVVGDRSTPLVPLLLAGGALLVGLVGAAVWWRVRSRRPASASARTPRPARHPTNGHEPSGEVRPAEQVELLIEEIALLDLAFDHGLVAQDVYDRLRAARKAELLELRTLARR